LSAPRWMQATPAKDNDLFSTDPLGAQSLLLKVADR
jgi:hypothetical protein